MTPLERAELAAELKISGRCNCAQAVAAALADETPLPAERLREITAGFCAGMGTMDGTCGALAGAILVVGLRTQGTGTMALSRKMFPRFKELCGATICRDLKGVDTGKVICSCEDCVRNAVRTVEEACA